MQRKYFSFLKKIRIVDTRGVHYIGLLFSRSFNNMNYTHNRIHDFFCPLKVAETSLEIHARIKCELNVVRILYAMFYRCAKYPRPMVFSFFFNLL